MLYLLHAGVVQERQQWAAVGAGWRLVVHHGDLDPSWVSTDAQTDQGDLDDGQQELETQGAADTEEEVTPAIALRTKVLCGYRLPRTLASSSFAPSF